MKQLKGSASVQPKDWDWQGKVRAWESNKGMPQLKSPISRLSSARQAGGRASSASNGAIWAWPGQPCLDQIHRRSGVGAGAGRALQQGVAPLAAAHLLQGHQIGIDRGDGRPDRLAPATTAVEDVPAQPPDPATFPTTFLAPHEGLGLPPGSLATPPRQLNGTLKIAPDSSAEASSASSGPSSGVRA